MSQIKIAENRGSRRSWAAAGFLLIIALSVIAYAVAPDVIRWVRRTFPAFAPAGMTNQQLQIAFAVIVFFMLALVVALIFAIAAPKKTLDIDETKMMKERNVRLREQRAIKQRQRRVNRQFRDNFEKRE